MNSCNFVGRITADPELKKTPSDLSVCSFLLAVNRPRVKGVTDFINMVAWRQTAEYIANYAQKGTLLAVCGVLAQRNYEDKNGNKRTVFEVVVSDANILESRKENKTNNAQNQQTDYTVIEADGDDDLPF